MNDRLVEQKEKMLAGFALNVSRNFTLEISCDDSEFTVKLNDIWYEKIAYNASALEFITDITISGATTINKAGYGGQVLIISYLLNSKFMNFPLIG